jgi:transposase-like protein
LAEISMTTNPLEGDLSADQIDALVTAAEDLGEGRNGVEELLSRMTRAVLERALETEMTDHLGYESGDPAGQGTLAGGVDLEGRKQVLGLWPGTSEGAKFWANALTEIRNRGAADILIVCCDGLTGLPAT